MFKNVQDFVDPLQQLHRQIRDAVVAACQATSPEALSAIAKEEAGDTIYAVDRVSEELLVNFFTQQVAVHTPIVLIAEGLERGKLVLPTGTPPAQARWRIIVDPIDGTRALY